MHFLMPVEKSPTPFWQTVEKSPTLISQTVEKCLTTQKFSSIGKGETDHGPTTKNFNTQKYEKKEQTIFIYKCLHIL